MSSQWSLQRLGEKNRTEIIAHYKELSKADLRFRFMRSIGEESLTGYVAGIDFSTSSVIGLYNSPAPERASPSLIGVGSASVTRADTNVAKVALSINALVRKQGLGAILLDQLIEEAKTLGSREVAISCFGSNKPMIGLAQKKGFMLVPDDYGNFEGWRKI